MSSYEYCVVEAFAGQPFTGNPAGVVLDADGLSDEQMRQIAAEVNVSETTFVLPPTQNQAAVRFRWFSPMQEVNMCGHATLAGVHALLEAGRFATEMREPGASLPIETQAGVLTARTYQQDQPDRQCVIWLDLVRPRLTRKSINQAKLAELLGTQFEMLDVTRPPQITQDGDLIVSVKGYAELLTMQPHFAELGEFCRQNGIRGVCTTTTATLTATMVAQSRFFAPAIGIDEDPVTGSVHGPLAVYLLGHGAVSAEKDEVYMECVQAKPGVQGRAGLVRIVATRREGGEYDVRIGGECVTTLKGQVVSVP